MKASRSYRWLKWFAVGVLLGIVANTIGQDVFNARYSTVILDSHHRLLSCELAPDQQWRFAPSQGVPHKLQTSIEHFEDEYFRWHAGVNPVAMMRAVQQNATAGRIVSGGSTITMQVARMSMQHEQRTVVAKVQELVFALCIEVAHSKDDILQMWADNAPFGGNIVGFQAASYAYFQRPPKELSWAEAALLAVLPNQPSMMYPGRNPAPLLRKRNQLLTKLLEAGELDEQTCELAQAEPLPSGVKTFPQLVPHLLVRARKNGLSGTTIVSTVDLPLQQKIQNTVNIYTGFLRKNSVHNAAVIVTHVPTGNVVAYVGNARARETENVSVDMISAPRSSGSILKPILHAARIDHDMLPFELLPDYPISFAGFRPRNYTRTWTGAAPADEALAQSLNVPAIYNLREYGVGRFLKKLQTAGFSTMARSERHYGLSLIVGGAEVTAWDLAGAYSAMSNDVRTFSLRDPMSDHRASYTMRYAQQSQATGTFQSSVSTAASYVAFQAMTKVKRPALAGNWQAFDASRRVAWKTGTSYGLRDAWSVGITPEYTVVVWVGNADGQGRAGLTGYGVAAPLLFSTLNLLPHTTWFEMPAGDVREVRTCRFSGQVASTTCKHSRVVFSSMSAKETSMCSYCTIQFLDSTNGTRVMSNSSNFIHAIPDTTFVLPPKMEWFYKNEHLEYRGLAKAKNRGTEERSSIRFVYPADNDVIHLPRDFDGERKPAVAKVVGGKDSEYVYWHLNEKCIGVTENVHEMPLLVEPGEYELSVIDDHGTKSSVSIEIRY